ncbi:unnamed protein product, partial [Prorocentrum cordatum]
MVAAASLAPPGRRLGLRSLTSCWLFPAKLREAVAEARDFVPPPPAAAQRTLEHQLQSATDRRINLQRQLDEAADALLAVEEHLDECRGCRDTCAASLAEAQAEEAKLLRSRAQASGIAPPTPGGSTSVTSTFDVASLENFSELEEEAQAYLRQMCEEGHRVTLEAQATFERNCQEQLQRFKHDVDEAAASKRRKRGRPLPDGPAGAPAQKPGAAAAAEQQAAPPAAAAAAAAPAAAAEPSSGSREHAARAAELGAAAAEAAIQRATEPRVARAPAICFEQRLPHLEPLALQQGSLEGDLRICAQNGNTWNSIASALEWLRRRGAEPRVTLAQGARFSSQTAEEQAHGWANRCDFQLACSAALRTGQQRGFLSRMISPGKGATIAVISVYLEESVGRRDQLVESLARPLADAGPEGPIEARFTQAEMALQARRRRGPGPGGSPGGCATRREQQLREAALRLRGEFQDLGATVFDGAIFPQTDVGCNLMAMIEQLAVKRARGGAQASKQKWDDFTEMAFERKGPAAREVSKKTHVEPTPVLEAGFTDDALVGQPALERVLADWPPLWVRPVRTKQERPGHWESGEWSLNPIAIDEFKLVARKFPNTFGLGWGNFHPRALLEVGGDVLRRLASALNSWERCPRRGELWAVIVVFLPEPDGGQRPIGLVPLLARIWSRSRLRGRAKWERSIDQQFNLEEAGSVYAALAKYSEHIGHEELRIAAQAWGFDQGPLRALCCTYLARPRARIGTCLSDAVMANGTVVAGCSRAAALAHLLRISALRAAAVAAPSARILNVVDDVSCYVTGPCTWVSQQLAAAYRAFCLKVKEAHLPLSRNKTKALATGRKLREALMRQPGWDIEGGDFVDVRRNLGGDSVAGSYQRATTAVARGKAARCQGGKLTRPVRPSISRARVVRAGPTAKASWGSAIIGVPNGRLRRLRVGAIKARGRLGRGAAPGLASLGQSGGWQRDPPTIVAKAALTAYVEMVWAPLLPESVARSCLAIGLGIAKRQRPWRMVKEPISALVLTLERVGWGFVDCDPYRIHDALGHDDQVRRYSQAFFGHVVSPDCRRAMGLEEVKRHGSSMWDWEIQPFWQPILGLTSHCPEVWDLRHQGAHPEHLRHFRCEAHEGWRREFLESPLREAVGRVERLGYPFTELCASRLFPDISELARLKDAEAIKVRAHLGPQTVREGLVTQFELDGVALADARSKEGAAAARVDSCDIHCVDGRQFVVRLAARLAAEQEGALEIIDLGEWPVDPAEVCEEDAAPSASADPVCTGGSPLPGLAGHSSGDGDRSNDAPCRGHSAVRHGPEKVDPASPNLLAQRQFAASKQQCQDESELLVVIRVVKAELKRSCLKIGKMDPFAVVTWTDGDGCQWQGSRTQTDHNGHLNPQWEHTCRGQQYSGRGCGYSVEFRVKDK